jgi:hypothetical protein
MSGSTRRITARASIDLIVSQRRRILILRRMKNARIIKIPIAASAEFYQKRARGRRYDVVYHSEFPEHFIKKK